MKKRDDDSSRLSELRKRAEASLEISEKTIPNLSPDEIRNLVREFRTYQIELELQNEELRHAEEEILSSREKYTDLFDFAPVGYITVSEKGMILESNLMFASMLGIERNRLINQPLSAYIANEDQDVYYLCRRKTLETKEQQTCELRLKLKEHLSVWVRIDFKVIESPEGGANQFYITISDIADLKKNQHKLTQSIEEAALQKKEISALLESAQAALECQTFEEAARGIFDACRKATGAVSGYVALLTKDGSENEILFLEDGGLPCDVNPELPMPIRGLREEAYRKKTAVYENDFSNSQWMEYMPEGHVTLENVLFAPLIHNDQTVGLLGIANKPGGFNDLDAKMAMGFAQQAAISLRSSRMVDEMREKDRVLNQTGKMARVGGWEHDLKTGKGTWTEALYEIIEIEPGEEPPGPNEHLNYYLPEHRSTLEEAYQRSIEDGIPFDLELQVYTEKKNLIWCRAYGEPVFQGGKCVKMRGTFQDITERKQAGIALEESEHRYRELFNHMSDGVAIYEAADNAEDFIFKSVNESGARIGKVNRDEVIGRRVTDVFPGIKEMGLFEVFHQVYRSGTPMHYPVSLYKDNRVSHWVENYVCKLTSGEIVAIYEDVTKRKQAEENLQSQTAFLKSLLSSIPSPVFYKDKECRYLGCNPAFEEIAGKKLHEIIGKTVFDVWKEGYRGIYNDKDMELIRNPGIQQYESKFETSNGIVRDVIFHKSTFYDQRGEVAGIIGVMMDITERKKAVTAIRESEQYARSILDSLSSHIAIVNKNGEIESVNMGWRNFAINHSHENPDLCEGANYFSVCDRAIGEDKEQAIAFSQAIRDVLSGQSDEYQMEYPCPPSSLWFKARITPFYGDRLNRVVVTHEDITERKQAENALRESEKKFRDVVSNIPGAVYQFVQNNDGSTSFPFMSRSAAELFNLPLDVIQDASSLSETVHPDDVSGLWASIDESAKDMTPWRRDFRILTGTNELKWIRGHSIPNPRPGGGIYWNGILLDVSGEKLAEEKIQRSEILLRKVIDTANCCIFVKDRDGHYVLVNQYMANLHNTQPELMTGQSDRFYADGKLSTTEEAERFRKEDLEVITDKQPRLIPEESFSLPGGELRWFQTQKAPIELPGRTDCVLGVAIDITERKQAESELIAATQREKQAVRAANVGLWDWNLATDEVYYSAEWKKQIGYEEHEIGNGFHEWKDRVHPGDLDRTTQYVNKMIQEKNPHYGIEYRFLHKDGSYIWILAQASVITDEYGQPIRVMGSHLDITERKKLEDMHKQKSDRLETILENIPIMVTFLDRNGHHQYVNRCWRQTLGYTLDEFQNRDLMIACYPDPEYRKSVMEFIADARNSWRDLSTHTRYGSVIQTTWTNVRLSNGAIVGIGLDITERKKLEDELHASKTLLDEAGRMARLGGWEVDTGTLKVRWTEETYRIHEVSSDYKPSLEEAINFFHPDCREELSQAIQRALDHGEPYDLELRFVTAQGKNLWTRTICHPEIENGKTVKLIGVFQDITERKQTELEKRETYDRLRFAMESANEGFWEWDFKTDLVSFDDMALQMAGYEPAMPPKPGKWWIEQIHPDERSRIEELFRSYLSGESSRYSAEFRLRRKDGEYIWVSSNARIIRTGSSGEPILVVGTHRDITEHKQAEEALIESELRFRSTFEQAAVGAAHVALDGRWLRVNNKLCDIVGYTREELLNVTFQDITHPEDLDADLNYVQQVLDGSIQTYSMEKRYIRKNGSAVWINLTVSLLVNSEGKPLYFISIIEDISSRKRVEQELKDNEERLQTIYDYAQDGILIADAQSHHFLEANKKMCEMLGYSLEEILKLSVSDIHPSESLDDVIEEFEKQARNEKLLAADLPVKRKDGTVFYADINSSPLTFRGKQCLLGIFRDITERKKYTDEIERSKQQLHALAERLITIREEEQTRIARELHDQLGHAMTGLKMDLNWLTKRIPDIPNKQQLPMIQNKITDMLNVTDATVKSVRQICTELRPGMLDNLGLIPTLEWELEEFQKRTGIQYNLDALSSVSIDSHRGTILYRIIQEALTNIIRHAQASKVRVFIIQEDGILTIEIADNGRGISETESSDVKSLGLLGMQERAAMLGGTISVIGRTGQGTTVRMMVPVNKDG